MAKLKVIAIIQSRMGSKRLKKKALKQILGKSLIWHIFRRLKAAKEVDKVVLSTSTKRENDILAKHAKSIGLECYRGSEQDLISRLFETAKEFKADALIRITGDCPLVDPDLIDELVRVFRKNPKKFDYLTNTYPCTFPHGFDIEIFPVKTLELINNKTRKESDYREAFNLYIRERPRHFRIFNLKNSKNLSHLRLTVDYPEDFSLIEEVFESLGKNNRIFKMKNIINLFKQKPHLKNINSFRVGEMPAYRAKGAKFDYDFVITDFDRTIMDLNVNWPLLRKKLASHCSSFNIDYNPSKPLFESIHDAKQDLLEKSGSKRKAETLHKSLLEILKKEEISSARKANYLEDAKDFLEWLAFTGVEYAVLSNNHSQSIIDSLNRLGFPRPKIVIGWDKVDKVKPDPQGLHKILNKMKLSSDKVVFVGDSNSDISVGKSQKVRTFIVKSFYAKNKIKRSWNKGAELIDDFYKLREVLM